MAGGEGRRLRPITCTMPKPMVKISGKPVLEYTFDLLLKHGFESASLTLGYMPDEIERKYENGYGELKLDFARENEPLGTAGGVKNALKNTEEQVLVISGDAVCDFDLSGIIRYHKASSAAVTVVAKRVDEPCEYGLVNISESNRIIGFTEKPGWSQAVIDTANTGVYVIEPEVLKLIPDGEKFDFAKDLFPLLLEKGIPMFCYVSDKYWCDIGSTESFLLCQNDALNGNFPTPKISLSEPADFTVIPPVFIGENVDISAGAVIGPYASLESGCSVASGAEIRYSSVGSNASVGRNASVTGSIVCSGAVVKNGAAVYENSVIGAGAVIGCNSTVKPNVKIWPQKIIPNNSVVDSNVKFGYVRHSFVSGDGFGNSSSERIDCETCLKIGRALGSFGFGKKTAVGTDGSPHSAVLAKALSAGIQSSGGAVRNFGECFRQQLEFGVELFGLTCGVYVGNNGNGDRTVSVCSEGGLPLSRMMERSLEACIRNGDYTDSPESETGDCFEIFSLAEHYEKHLIKQVPSGLTDFSVGFKSDNPLLEYTANRVLKKLNAIPDDNLVFYVSSDGCTLKAVTKNHEAEHHMLLAIACCDEMKKGKDIALAYDAPRFIDELGEKFGVSVHRYSLSAAEGTKASVINLAIKQPFLRDPLFLAVRILSIIQESGLSLDELLMNLPQKYIKREKVMIDYPPSSLAEKLFVNGEASEKSLSGIMIQRSNGKVFVVPERSGDIVRVLAESDSMEAAEELCGGIAEKILSFNKNNINNSLT